MAGFVRRTVRIINILTLVALALPICALIGMYLAVSFNLMRAIPVPDVLADFMGTGRYSNGIEAGNDPKQMQKLFEKLQDKSATASDAVLAERLNIVFVLYTEDKPGGDAGKKPNTATRFLDVDLSQSKDTATLLISNRPLMLDISTGFASPFAKLAVEGRHPFDVNGAPDGLLAGFHIDAFGARRSATLNTLKKGSSAASSKRKYCKTISRWRRFFDVDHNKIKVWQVTNPEVLKSRESDIFIEGGYGKHSWPYVPKCR